MFVFSSKSGHLQKIKFFLFLAPLFLLNYFVKFIFVFWKSGAGLAPPSAQSLY